MFINKFYRVFLMCFLIAANLNCAAQNSVANKQESKTKADITGRIIKKNPASAGGENSNFLGSVYVEGSGNYDRANINVTGQTNIYVLRDGERQAAKFEDLQVGAEISAGFTGPVLESYPVQATAGEIVILKSETKNQNPVLRKKVETAFDFNSGKSFRFPLDAPEIFYFEKASTAYLFEKGKFRPIVTSD